MLEASSYVHLLAAAHASLIGSFKCLRVSAIVSGGVSVRATVGVSRSLVDVGNLKIGGRGYTVF